ncbi:MAG: type I methionyl aminopeptidase [Candidatus Magasanikbacteria bacterium RIFOXYD2_FULL_41_14]|uniref:Methionine aminopeptidase n=1 Tax=Candidatus Magasanikbacteria bacterium RIFOXYD2_FULL_41_14 TaxID=1798709 RepID=A0A1F6PBX9_9BACT|nr:MAG: type I methionyl aminopeptidase [Candidatus Magasanikbacteria bacterium RIFOXYD2_FULL_41_14]
MAYIKTREEANLILQGGKKMGKILEDLGKMAKAGISAYDLDQIAEKMIIASGGVPAFKGYRGHPSDPPFPSTMCCSVNEELVHGVARKKLILQDGDIFSLDIGMQYPAPKKDKRGYFTDTAITVAIGRIPDKTKELMRVTKESLEVGIKAAKPGVPVSAIGKAIEQYVKSQGKYGIVRDLVGHGVGHAVHEDPRVPNYYDKRLDKFILQPGMVIAIEPMISLGSYEIITADDGWTISMADGSLCAHFEHTLVITEKGNKVATRRPGERF